MDRNETKNIIRFISDCYPTFHPNNISEMIDTWTAVLSEYSFKDMQAAFLAYARSDTSGFAPTPGQLIDWQLKLRHDEKTEMSALEAWALVYKAICNSGYNAEAEFQKLPEAAQRAVGSPQNLKDWALMDTETVQSVEQSHFIRAYNTEIRRMREDLKLPEGMRRPALEKKAPEQIEDKTDFRSIPFSERAPQELVEKLIRKLEEAV